MRRLRKARRARIRPESVGGNRERSFDFVYRKLHELIVRGRLAPGTRVVEADIAERLQVSRTPVRSALHRLQQEGHVVAAHSNRQSRLAVAPLTKEDAHELYWIVGHLEGMAGRLVAQLNRDVRALVSERLQVLNSELDHTSRTSLKEANRIFNLDASFHQVLVDSAAGPRLSSLYTAIKPQSERYSRLYASGIIDELAKAVGEHVVIIEAIQRGDPDAAEQAIHVNWENGAERLAIVIDSLGERGSW